MLGLPVLWASLAFAFDIAGVEAKWQDALYVEDIPTSPPPPIDEISAARGEQVHLAWWLINDSGSPIVVEFATSALTTGTDTLPDSAFEVRLLTYRHTTTAFDAMDTCSDTG